MDDSNHPPKWAVSATPDEDCLDLREVIQYAQTQYGRHIDWYLHHRDTGIKSLVVLLTGELAVASVGLEGVLDKGLAVASLVLAAGLAVVMTWLSLLNCRQSYKGSVENALALSKAAWASGWFQSVKVAHDIAVSPGCPAPDDESLYVPRYIKDAQSASTTEEFTSTAMSKKGTTYFAARCTLLLLGSVGCLVAFVSILVIV